ncbi:MAG TPA: TlpA disulfide reductase family protein, partial [Thermoanaerobaculia bacterium]|nr:TlpA disulfide reductase family protein [Thermoanaerobaculia bacterium]
MKKLLVALMMIAALACKRGEEKQQTGTAGYATRGAQKAAPQTQTVPAGSEVGSSMPEYAAMWLDGSKFELEARRDKVVLLNVWATWCAPCRLEIPELQKVHDKYAPKGFEVVGVSLDES